MALNRDSDPRPTRMDLNSLRNFRTINSELKAARAERDAMKGRLDRLEKAFAQQGQQLAAVIAAQSIANAGGSLVGLGPTSPPEG